MKNSSQVVDNFFSQVNTARNVLILLFICTLAFTPNTFARYGPIKLFIISLTATIILIYVKKSFKTSLNKITLLILLILIISVSVNLIISKEDPLLLFFGAGGRYTGAFAFIIFFLLLYYFSSINIKNLNTKILFYLTIIGFILSAYGILQYLNLDPFDFSKEDRQIFLTLGNSNFSSAFLAMCSIANLSLLLFEIYKLKLRILLFMGYLFVAYTINLVGDDQGTIILLFGLIGLLLLKLDSITLNKSYLNKLIKAIPILFILISIVTLTRGSGPLKRIFEVSSFKDRVEIWLVGIEIFRDNFLWGIGYDSFISGYPSYRTSRSILNREVDINSYSAHAHNSVINIAATGGIFLLLIYLVTILLVFHHAYRLYRSSSFKDYGLIMVWNAFFLQSMVSIDNIVISGWGFSVAGVLISNSLTFTNYAQTSQREEQKLVQKAKSHSRKFGLIKNFSLTAVIFAILILPFNNLIKQISFANALSQVNNVKSQDLLNKNIENLIVITSSLIDLEPKVYLVRLLFNNNYIEQAEKLAIAQTISYPSRVLAWDSAAAVFESQQKFDRARPFRLKSIQLDPLNFSFKSKLELYK